MQGSSVAQFRSFSGSRRAAEDVARWRDAALATRGIRLELWIASWAVSALIADMALWAVDDAFGSPVWLLYGATVLMAGLAFGLFVEARLRSLRLRANDANAVEAGRAPGNGCKTGTWDASTVPYSPWLFYERLREEVERSRAEGLNVGVIVARVGRRDRRYGESEDRPAAPAREPLRSGDVLGRLAADEYALYMPETDHAGALAAGAALTGLFEELSAGAIGVAAFPDDGGSPAELVDVARRRALLPRAGGPVVAD